MGLEVGAAGGMGGAINIFYKVIAHKALFPATRFLVA